MLQPLPWGACSVPDLPFGEEPFPKTQPEPPRHSSIHCLRPHCCRQREEMSSFCSLAATASVKALQGLVSIWLLTYQHSLCFEYGSELSPQFRTFSCSTRCSVLFQICISLLWLSSYLYSALFAEMQLKWVRSCLPSQPDPWEVRLVLQPSSRGAWWSFFIISTKQCFITGEMSNLLK